MATAQVTNPFLLHSFIRCLLFKTLIVHVLVMLLNVLFVILFIRLNHGHIDSGMEVVKVGRTSMTKLNKLQYTVLVNNNILLHVKRFLAASWTVCAHPY